MPDHTYALLEEIFDDLSHPLLASCERWMRSSARFQRFVVVERSKIRKKVRNARDTASWMDLEAELLQAYQLVQHRHCSLVYEPYNASKQRGPDFAVTYRGTLIYLEVTRIRADPAGDPEQHTVRLMTIVCGKLGQFRDRAINVLSISTPSSLYQMSDLDAAMRQLRHRAEQGEQAWFARHGWESTRVFLRQYPYLSGLLIQTPDVPPLLWRNPAARIPIPAPISTMLQTRADQTLLT